MKNEVPCPRIFVNPNTDWHFRVLTPALVVCLCLIAATYAAYRKDTEMRWNKSPAASSDSPFLPSGQPKHHNLIIAIENEIVHDTLMEASEVSAQVRNAVLDYFGTNIEQFVKMNARDRYALLDEAWMAEAVPDLGLWDRKTPEYAIDNLFRSATFSLKRGRSIERGLGGGRCRISLATQGPDFTYVPAKGPDADPETVAKYGMILTTPVTGPVPGESVATGRVAPGRLHVSGDSRVVYRKFHEYPYAASAIYRTPYDFPPYWEVYLTFSIYEPAFMGKDPCRENVPYVPLPIKGFEFGSTDGWLYALGSGGTAEADEWAIKFVPGKIMPHGQTRTSLGMMLNPGSPLDEKTQFCVEVLLHCLDYQIPKTFDDVLMKKRPSGI
jgi:hypothetical protein